MDNTTNNTVFGMIGLGTMGCNLLLNMADHGFAVSGYDKDPHKVEEFIKEGKDKPINGYHKLEEFIASMQKPRAMMMLVPAGKIVDSVIAEIKPFLEPGDILIDGGNSHFTDTDRRVEELSHHGIHFFGMGISGGEEGARKGPSMMPGGDKTAYKHVKHIFESIAAKVNNDACVAYIGPGASGHFVKMVHNGIEYAIMQLIAETYEVLRKDLKLDNSKIHQIFEEWTAGRHKSFLMEITRDIFVFKEDGQYLIDLIKDEAKSKGTGKWTSQIAMDLQSPVTAIDTSVSMRDLSKLKELRTAASKIYETQASENTYIEQSVKDLDSALYFAVIVTYAQGMHLLSMASAEFSFGLNMQEIAKIWRGGCIIRSQFLENIREAYQDENLQHLLLDKKVAEIIIDILPAVRKTLVNNISKGIASPALSACLSYFDAFRSENMPSNLIQAQRDFFGAHTYERKDKPGVFHSEWVSYTKP